MEEKLEQITLDIPDGYEFFGINDDNKVVLTKKHIQYPKTYKECCDVLKIKYPDFIAEEDGMYASTYKNILFGALKELIICRDAYWKIAGEEMGLGKPWEPDYDSGVNKYGIIYMNKLIQKSTPTTNWERHLNKILDFPTKEIRDAFYEHFRFLIGKCKELL